MDEIVERRECPTFHIININNNRIIIIKGVSFDDLRILRNEVHSIVNNRFDEVKNHVHAIENRINHNMRNRKTVVEKKNESFEDEIIGIIKVSLETKSNTYKELVLQKCLILKTYFRF